MKSWGLDLMDKELVVGVEEFAVDHPAVHLIKEDLVALSKEHLIGLPDPHIARLEPPVQGVQELPAPQILLLDFSNQGCEVGQEHQVLVQVGLDVGVGEQAVVQVLLLDLQDQLFVVVHHFVQAVAQRLPVRAAVALRLLVVLLQQSPGRRRPRRDRVLDEGFNGAEVGARHAHPIYQLLLRFAQEGEAGVQLQPRLPELYDASWLPDQGEQELV